MAGEPESSMDEALPLLLDEHATVATATTHPHATRPRSTRILDLLPKRKVIRTSPARP
jgi:hypothetical protein